MKNIVMLIVLLLLVPVLAGAATLEATFSWDGATDPDSFVMYERTTGGKVEMATAVGTARIMSWEEADPLITDCRTFFMTAVTDGIHSNPSNPYALCPDIILPDMIVRPGGTINLQIQVLP